MVLKFELWAPTNKSRAQNIKRMRMQAIEGERDRENEKTFHEVEHFTSLRSILKERTSVAIFNKFMCFCLTVHIQMPVPTIKQLHKIHDLRI